MPMRNPIYLDQALMQNAADYFGVPYDLEAKVTESGTRPSTVTGSAKSGLIDGSDDMVAAFQTSYEIPAKPLRMMNDVIDQVDRSNDLKTEVDLSLSVTKGDVIELQGSLKLSAASEVGSILSKIIPVVAAAKGKISAAQQATMAASMLAGASIPKRQLFELELDSDSETRVFLSIDHSHFFRTNSFDDIEADVSVFGTVERIVNENASMSFDRWILPDVDRSLRRMMQKQGLDKMLEGVNEMMDIDLDEAKSAQGPAIEIRVMAIY